MPPPVLAGRDELLDDAVEALVAGPRHPLFSRVFHGTRGTGKTVLLDALGDRARARRWTVVPLACGVGTGVVESLVDLHLPELLRRMRVRGRARGRAERDLHATVGVKDVAEVTAGATWPADQRRAGVELQRLLSLAGTALAERDRLLLLTVDELHAIDRRFDLPSLAGVLQLLTQRQGLPIAFVGAGLPEVVDVLGGPAVTFLERLRKIEIGELSPDATRYALLAPAQAQDVRIDLDALELLAVASSGYPYYVQLLGWEAWAAAAAARGNRITAAHARAGIASAEVVIAEQIFEPRLRRLAPREQDYLRAMAVDGDEPATTGDLVSRLGVRRASDISYLRDRLLAKHLIRATGRGQVAFALPGMGRWLHELGADPAPAAIEAVGGGTARTAAGSRGAARRDAAHGGAAKPTAISPPVRSRSR